MKSHQYFFSLQSSIPCIFLMFCELSYLLLKDRKKGMKNTFRRYWNYKFVNVKPYKTKVYRQIRDVLAFFRHLICYGILKYPRITFWVCYSWIYLLAYFFPSFVSVSLLYKHMNILNVVFFYEKHRTWWNVHTLTLSQTRHVVTWRQKQRHITAMWWNNVHRSTFTHTSSHYDGIHPIFEIWDSFLELLKLKFLISD